MSEYVFALLGPTTPGVSGLVIPAVAALSIALAVGSAVLAWGPVFGRFLVREPRECRFVDYSPFLSVEEDGCTLRCKRGYVVWVWSLEGLDHETLSDADLDRLFFSRFNLVNNVCKVPGASGLRMNLFTFRERVMDEEPGDRSVGGRSGEGRGYLGEIGDRWDELTREGIFRNRHYVAVYGKGAGVRAKLGAVDAVLRTSFVDYGPKLLRVGDKGDSPVTPFAAFLSPCTRPNPRIEEEMAVTPVVACEDVVYEGGGLLKFQSGGKKRYCAVVGIQGLHSRTSESVILELQRVNGELLLFQSVCPYEKTTAMGDLGRETVVERGNAPEGVDRGKEHVQVLSILEGAGEGMPQGEFCLYQLTIFVYGRDEKEVERVVDDCQRALSAAQVVSVREGMLAQSFFWGALPGFEVLGRPWRLLSLVVAGYWMPQCGSEGVGRHDWLAYPVTRYRSAGGSMYRFCFHPTGQIQEAGHVIVVGPAGRGKTTMLAHLAGQTLLRVPRSRVWLFDRFHGAEVFVRSVGGRYVRLEGVRQQHEQDETVDRVALNPLLLPDQGENRAFVRQWLAGLVGRDLTPQVEAEVSRAVAIVFGHAPAAHRTLKHLYYSAFGPGSPARDELARWVLDEELSGVFNAPADTVGELDANLVGFDCTQAIDDPLLAGPIVSYLMHRIRMESVMRGDPTLIVVDETEPLLRDEDFNRFFRQGLQEGRKLRQVFVSCFQRPGAVERLGLGDLIRGQCPTAVFMRNPAAKAEDYEMFELTGAEVDFVLGRTYQDLSYGVLVKRYEGRHTAILDTSLLGLGELLRLYSSSRLDVLALRSAIGEWGWEKGVRRYLKRD